MNFNPQLRHGTFLKRYKRFFADIKLPLDNLDLRAREGVITAHVPNSGSMKGCNSPESRCLYSMSDSLTRKIPFTLEAVESGESGNRTWVGVNTSHPNRLVEETFKSRLVSDWKKYDRCAREVKISNESRIDLVLWKSKEAPE